MTIIGRLSSIAFLTCLAFGTSVADESYDAATRAAIQGVISKQLQAFAQGDAAAAEAYASPGIQKKFPEPTKFLDMVRTSYAALIKPKSTQFGETSDSPHGPIQKVTIVAADGTVWSAIYALEKADNGWRITGCGLEKVEGQQDI